MASLTPLDTIAQGTKPWDVLMNDNLTNQNTNNTNLNTDKAEKDGSNVTDFNPDKIRVGAGADTSEKLQVSGTAKVQVTDAEAWNVKNGSGLVVNKVDTASNTFIHSVNIMHYSRVAYNASGSSIFVTLVSGKPQWGKLFAYEIGTSNFCEYSLYKKDETVGTTASLINNAGLTIQATNAGGTIALIGFTDTNNVRMCVEYTIPTNV